MRDAMIGLTMLASYTLVFACLPIIAAAVGIGVIHAVLD